MVIVEAPNENEARAQFAADVMVKTRTLTLEPHEFRPFYKGTFESVVPQFGVRRLVGAFVPRKKSGDKSPHSKVRHYHRVTY